MPISPSYFTSRLDRTGVRMKGLNSEQVSYKRGTNIIPDIAATLILTDNAEELINNIAVIRTELQDFVIDSEALISNSLGVPKTGDEIIRANGEIYRILSMGNDDPPYRYTTSSRLRMMIHTKRFKK